MVYILFKDVLLALNMQKPLKKAKDIAHLNTLSDHNKHLANISIVDMEAMF